MTSPFNDEQLSAVLDGTADPELVGRVQASPEASDRLDQLRRVRDLVATPPVGASPERRAASIAAALAAAEVAAPEGVSSLSVAREKAEQKRRLVDRFSPQVMAAAAALLLVVIVAPFLISRSGDNTSDFAAETTADAADDGMNNSLAETAGADAMEESDDDSGSADSAMADTAEAPAADEAMEADLLIDDSADDVSDDAASAGEDEVLRIFPTNSPVQLLASIDLGTVAPNLFLSDPELRNSVNPECLAPFTEAAEPTFALSIIDGPDISQFVVIHFDEDGTNTLFDAEDCSPVG
jgi:negative regulator of sigma E activity